MKVILNLVWKSLFNCKVMVLFIVLIVVIVVVLLFGVECICI